MFGKDIQVGRLLQIHRQRFLESTVKNRIGRGVHKICDQNCIPLRHHRPGPAQEDGHCQSKDSQYNDRHDYQIPDPAGLPLARRPERAELDAAEIKPESVSRFNRFRSARTSAALW